MIYHPIFLEDVMNGKIWIRFEIPITDIKNKVVKLIIPDYFFVKDMEPFDFYIDHNLNGIDEHFNTDPIITGLHYDANKYFCKKLGKKTKYKNNKIIIPLITLFDKATNKSNVKYNIYAIEIVLHMFLNEKTYWNDIFLKIKNNIHKNYVYCPIENFEFSTDIIYICLWYIKRNDRCLDNVISIWNYEDKFYQLIEKHKNATFKIKEIDDKFDFVIFKKIDKTYFNNEFLFDLEKFIVSIHKNKFARHFLSPTLILKS